MMMTTKFLSIQLLTQQIKYMFGLVAPGNSKKIVKEKLISYAFLYGNTTIYLVV
jgi:hypothetical protein